MDNCGALLLKLLTDFFFYLGYIVFLAHVQKQKKQKTKGGHGTSAPHKNKNPNKPRCHGTSAPHKKHTQSRVDIKHWHTFKNHVL